VSHGYLVKLIGMGVDDSVGQPFSPNAHTQGPIYLVGERGADLIKADHAGD
jgi:hypothetical protein